MRKINKFYSERKIFLNFCRFWLQQLQCVKSKRFQYSYRLRCAYEIANPPPPKIFLGVALFRVGTRCGRQSHALSVYRSFSVSPLSLKAYHYKKDGWRKQWLCGWSCVSTNSALRMPWLYCIVGNS